MVPTKADVYRAKAKECRDIARYVSDVRSKRALEDTARAWLEKAEREEVEAHRGVR